jgi:predicted amidophosphoribosyltransferase
MAIDVVAETLEQVRDLVWPPRCIDCDRRLEPGDRVVCSACEPLLRRVEEPTCPTCGLPLHHSESDADAPCRSCRRNSPPQTAGFAYWLYDGAAMRGLQHAKYAGGTWRLRALAEEMRDWCRRMFRALRPSDPTVPVRTTAIPMHPSELRERGFNAATRIGRVATADAPPRVEFRWNALEQTSRTRPQAGLTRGERRDNVRGVFSVRDARRVRGADWCLFDDVSTTGATLAEAAGELLDAGARNVYTVAAARTPKPAERGLSA